ncbi:MAG: type II secretion system F family protein [Chloroflexota bacterium]
MSIYLIPLLLIVTVLCIAAAIYQQLAADKEMSENVLTTFGTTKDSRTLNQKLTNLIDKRIVKRSTTSPLEQKLIAADSKMTVAEFVLARLSFGGAGFLLGWFISDYLFGGLLLGIAASMIPSFQLNRQIRKRSTAIEAQLPDMLALMSGSLSAGYGLLQACNVVKHEMPQPISHEFARLIKETSLGISLADALDHMVERVKNEDLEMMVTAIHIQNEVGGSLAEVLETITHTIRERIELRGEIKSLTAQQRMTGWILSLLPFGVAIVMMMISPDYMMGMFQPGWTLLIPISAVIMIIIGNIAMRYLMKIEV